MSLLEAAPKLDTRTQEDIYQACVEAAAQTLPEWALGFPRDDDGNLADPGYFDGTDPGLVLFKLFGELFRKLTTPLDGVPGKYALTFWHFMGLTLRSAQAAGAPVSFVSNVETAVEMPKQTRIIGTDIPGIVFETTTDLTVLPLAVEAAFAVHPTADAYVDCSGRVDGGGAPFALFGDAPAQIPFVHALYISDPSFDAAGLQGKLSFVFQGANLYEHYFAACFNMDDQPLKPYIEAAYDALTVTFAGLPNLPLGDVDGIVAPWLRLSPADIRIVPFLADALPEIFSVALDLTLSAVAADTAFYNSQEVDLKKGGQPFGAEPALQDAFYIASKSVFSHAEIAVTLDFELEPIDPPEPVILSWEFWDGKGWGTLSVTDSTANLTRSGTVVFTCPQIVPTEINNDMNYWIRVRIAEGGYGSAAGLLVTESAKDIVDTVIGPYVTDKAAAIAVLAGHGINFGYEYQPASFTPPFVLALEIGGRIVKRPDLLVQRNGFDYAELGLRPFLPWPEVAPTFYLGLSIRDYAAVAGRPLTLLFAPEGNTEITFDPPVAEVVPEPSRTAGATPLTLSCWSPEGWQKLPPIGSASQAGAQGILTVRAPADFTPHAMLGKALYWLRIDGPPGMVMPPCPMKGIFPNVAPAVNAVTYEDVVLGSSTGAPNQIFLLPQQPVLEGAVIEVLEPLPPAPPLAPDAPAPVPQPTGPAATGSEATGPVAAGPSAKQAWIRWRAVDNFDFSTPFSRDYLLDFSSGALTFGNGINGMIPLEGVRNIRAAFYQNGGGTVGNVGAGMLNDLQQMQPAIESVRNVIAATGGLEADQPAALQTRAPGQIRSMDRAVTAADFAALALAASQEVAQAVCLDGDPSVIRLIILPNGAGPVPQPSADLLKQVESFVEARALPLLVPLIDTGGPDYRAIDATFSIIPAAGAPLDTADKAIKAAMAAFLNPLTGGPDGTGWRFGARLDAAALATMARACPGVGMVRRVTLEGGRTAVNLAADQLPRPGKILVERYDASTI